MPTTIDNPFDPFTEFDDWRLYDEAHGYNTLLLWAQEACTSIALSDETNEEEMERACQALVDRNILGIHIKAIEGKPNGTKNLKLKPELDTQSGEK